VILLVSVISTGTGKCDGRWRKCTSLKRAKLGDGGFSSLVAFVWPMAELKIEIEKVGAKNRRTKKAITQINVCAGRSP
jgi:hypothetical protein